MRSAMRWHSILIALMAIPAAWAAPAVTYRTTPVEPRLWGVTKIGTVEAQLDEDFNGIDDSLAEVFGLAPGDDATADSDSDGLTHEEEIAARTHPRVADTDGDGISDGDELLGGSNPLDPTDAAANAQLIGIRVKPQQTRLTTNALFPDQEVSIDLRVTALLENGTSVNVTAFEELTTYSSNDTSVATVSALGRVVAQGDGTATILVQHRGQTDVATVEVETFSPATVGHVSMDDGFARRVAVLRGVAYVADGPGGLRLVDVSDPTAPSDMTSVELADARAVVLAGQQALVANGAGGLALVDVADPSSPIEINVGGTVTDVAVLNGAAWVATDVGLLAVNLATRMVDGTLPSVTATEVAIDDVLRQIVVADGTDVRRVGTSFGVDLGVLSSEVQDVMVQGVLAFFATGSGGVQTFNISSALLTPFGQTVSGGAHGIDLAGALLFVAGGAAELAIHDVSDGDSPQLRGEFPLTPDATAEGVAVSGGYAYVAAGAMGLDIIQYVQLNDSGQMPPSVAITSPAPGTPVTAGESLSVTVQASDDVAVFAIEWLVNQQVVAREEGDAAAFREETKSLFLSAGTVRLGARAIDLAGNPTGAAEVELVVTAGSDDVPPIVQILSPTEGTTVSGGRAFWVDVITDDAASVEFFLNGNAVGQVSVPDPFELAVLMPQDGEAGDTFTLTARAQDFSGNTSSDVSVNLIHGGPSEQIVSECQAGVPVYELRDEGATGNTTHGKNEFKCANLRGESGNERIYVYTVRPDRPLQSLTFRVDAEFDAVLHARRGLCVDVSAQIQCSDQDLDGDTGVEEIAVTPETGLYYVFVDAHSGAGEFAVTVEAEDYPLCGNTICEAIENCESCPFDCGGCCLECGDACTPFSVGTDTYHYRGCAELPETIPCPDISTGGTALSLADDNAITVPVGFTFDYYGQSGETLWVSANGMVGLANDFTYIDQCPPELVNTIYAWRDDLYPPAEGARVSYMTSGAEPNRTFEVQWQAPHFRNRTDPAAEFIDVRLVLHESTDNIDICYVDTTVGADILDYGIPVDNGRSAAAGIQGDTTNRFLKYSCGEAVLTPGLVLHYYAPPQ